MTIRNQPLVYVLTPVYNGEKYLAECIESVLAQSYQNWQYCILNNRSTDKSRHIAETYAKKDERISVLDTPEFLNHLANQNLGLRRMPAEAKFCKIVHADDWLFPECLSRMVEVAESNSNVVLVGAYGLRQDHVAWDGLPYTTSVMNGRELCRRTLLGGPYLFGSPTSLLLTSGEVRKRPNFFSEAHPHADKEVCFDLLRSGDFGFVHQVLTFTREHSEARSSSTKNLHTHELGDLIILRKYGAVFLNPNELELCERRRWKAYYALLGGMVFYRKAPQFWQYHRNSIRNLGSRLNWVWITAVAAINLLDIVFNPLKTSGRIVNRLGRLWDKRRRLMRAGLEN